MKPLVREQLRYSLFTYGKCWLTDPPHSHTVSVGVTIRLRDVYGACFSETEVGVAVGYNVERPV